MSNVRDLSVPQPTVAGVTGDADVVVATGDGVHVLTSGARELEGRDVRDLLATDGRVLALVEDGEILERDRDGRWTSLARIEDGRARVLAAHGGALMVGGAEARLWRVTGDVVERVSSFDDAPTRDEWHTPWGGPPDVFSMVSDGSELFVGVHVGGIIRSTDGETWTATIDLHDDMHQVALDDDGSLWVATGRNALAHSSDRGASWVYHRAGLHATYAVAVAVSSEGPLVAVSSGPFARDGRVYRLVDDVLTPVAGLPDDVGIGHGQLAATGDLAVAGGRDGEAFVSDDGGRSWTLIATGLGEVRRVAIVPAD